MSIAIPIPLVQAHPNAKKISNDCSIKQLEQKQNPLNFIKSYYTPTKSISAYTYNQTHFFLPFSYVYNFLPSLFKLPSTPSINLKFTGELLDRQKAIRKDTFDILNETKSIVLCLHTGFGKTIFAIYLACKIGKKTIVCCHRKIIMDQWISAIQRYCPNATIGILDAKLKTKPDFLIANSLNIPKYDIEYFKDYGLVICDEIHTMCTEQYSKSLLLLCPEYIIGLSATPHRSDGMDRIIDLYVGPHQIVRKMKRIFNVYRFKTKCEFTPERQPDGSLDWNSVLEEQATREERNKMIVDLCNFFTNRVILVLVKRKDHAMTLQREMKAIGIDVDVFFGTAKVVNYDCRVLIATYSKGGVGFDHPKLDMLITAADVEENFMQYLGRIFRRDDNSPIYIDMIDELQTIKKHSSTRIRICKEVGAAVFDFNSSFPDFNLFCKHI